MTKSTLGHYSCHPALIGVELPWLKVAPDTPVTRDAMGRVASIFSEDTWNVSAYGKSAIKNLRFQNFVEPGTPHTLEWTIRLQLKQVMFMLMHESRFEMPAVGSISKWFFLLRVFTRYASQSGLSLFEGMQNLQLVTRFVRERNPECAVGLSSVTNQLHRLGEETTGLSLPIFGLRKLLRARADEADSNQTPVIPTRIYAYFLAQSYLQLQQMEAAILPLCELVRGMVQGEELPSEPAPELATLLTQWQVNLHCKLELFGLPGLVAYVCETIIQAWSGMRSAEVQGLPFSCLKEVQQSGLVHYMVAGITTKLNHGKEKRVEWVTIDIAARAIRVAQQVFGTVHQAQMKGKRKTHTDSTDGRFLLFCRTGIGCHSIYQANLATCVSMQTRKFFLKQWFLPITQNDIEELKVIEPHRAWDEDPNFAVGELWPFASHQLRRSLAVYGQQTGMVSLPSMQRQFQHITAEMSMYYGKGSAFAKGFAQMHKEHFSNEWNATSHEAIRLAYAAQVLLSEEPLYGGHGAYVMSATTKASPVSVYNPKELLKMIKRGQISYKANCVGGCTSTEPCESTPFEIIPWECLKGNCKSLVVKRSRLTPVLESQRRLVQMLDRDTPELLELRIEREMLATLEKWMNNICSAEEK